MKKLFFAIAIMASLVACQNNEPTVPKDENGNNSQSEPEQPQVRDTFGTVETRKVVVEEYTGINCGYCPEGHKIVNDLVKTYSGNVFAVNIHAGPYAANTYTTTEGNAYLSEAGVGGYPAGVVNRHNFDEKGGMAMSRGDFAAAARKIMKMNTPVNIQATAEIDSLTRNLTVKVNGNYTVDALDDSDKLLSQNSIYVMLLQDSVLGYQNGASGNPEQIIDGRYCHMHMLRATINGKWGDQISSVVAGATFSKEYNYTIPETIGSDKVPAVLEHLKVIVFVAEGHKEIYTATEPEVVLK